MLVVDILNNYFALSIVWAGILPLKVESDFTS